MARRISMATRGELLEVVRGRYGTATRAERTRILDEFTAVAGYHRKHAIRLLGAAERQQDEQVEPIPPGKGRVRTYGPEVREALIQLWEVSDRVCGKRLRPMVPALLPALERHGRLDLDETTRAKLLKVSAASIDRLLTEIRVLAGSGRRRPAGFGTAVRRSVPVRTFNDWNDPAPGWVEADFVTHGGTLVAGAYVLTLVLTDVATGWTECIPLVVREAEMVVHALERARQLFPFPLRGIDFDNDSLFMNEAVVGWCRAAGLEVTRSRAYRKNDQAWVEQKNGAIVRRLVGYGRFEGVLAGEALARLYAASRQHGNLFQPSFKLREKRREGARVIKRYHAPEPPVARTLSHGAVSEADKARLRVMLANADPVLLLAEIRAAQAHLGKRVDERGAGAERIADPEPVNIERFAASLKVAWSVGERPPTHRRPYIRRKPLVRPWIMDGVRERITAWLEVQPALSAVAILARLQEMDPGRFQARHERTVQRFVKLRRAAMARDVLFGGSSSPTCRESDTRALGNVPT